MKVENLKDKVEWLKLKSEVCSIHATRTSHKQDKAKDDDDEYMRLDRAKSSTARTALSFEMSHARSFQTLLKKVEYDEVKHLEIEMCICFHTPNYDEEIEKRDKRIAELERKNTFMR